MEDPHSVCAAGGRWGGVLPDPRRTPPSRPSFRAPEGPAPGPCPVSGVSEATEASPSVLAAGRVSQKGFWHEAGLKGTLEKKQRGCLVKGGELERTRSSVTVGSGRTLGNVGLLPRLSFPVYAPERLKVSLGKGGYR